MGLYIRMIFYAISAGMAGFGFAAYDPVAQTLTIKLDLAAELMAGGVAAFLATFAAGRIAKKHGGTT